MCLAIPARVVEILLEARATVDLGGIRKSIDVSLLGDVALDEYVVVHVGFAIGRIDPDEAARTLALFAELGLSRYEAERPDADAACRLGDARFMP